MPRARMAYLGDALDTRIEGNDTHTTRRRCFEKEFLGILINET